MNRIGHASSPNSAMNWTRSPSVTSPVETRHDPTARSATAPIAGSASSAGSKPARMKPAWTRSCCSARRLDRQTLGLVGLAPERLHDHRAVDASWATDETSPIRSCARRAGPLHPSSEAAVHQRERREQQDADHREVRGRSRTARSSRTGPGRARPSRTGWDAGRPRPPRRRPPCARSARRSASPCGTAARDRGTGRRSACGAWPSRARRPHRCSSGGP